MINYKKIISLKFQNSKYNCDAIFLSHDVDKSDLKDGKPYSKILDSILEDCILNGLKTISISLPNSKFIGINSWSNSKSFESFFKQNLFNRLLLKGLYRLGFKKLYNVLKSNQKLTNNSKWIKIFTRLKPKVVFIIGATPEICSAAKSCGVILIEVLHGLGYSKLPWNWSNLNSDSLPEFVVCFDKVSFKTFSLLEKDNVKVLMCKHPWYKRFENIDYKLIDKKWLSFPLNVSPKYKLILITLVWGYDGDDQQYNGIVENGLIPKILLDVIGETKEYAFYLLRRHPVQFTQAKYDYQQLFLESVVKKYTNCEYEVSTSSSLISVLYKVDGHITLSSMSSYDASLMGVKTLFLCPTLLRGGFNSTLFTDLVEDGYAEKVDCSWDVNKIKRWIYSVRRIEKRILNDYSDFDLIHFIKSINNFLF